MRESRAFSSNSKSNVGMVRKNNEDSYLFETFGQNGVQEAFLAAVADGMGGHAAGEVASSKVIEVFKDRLQKQPLKTIPDKLKELVEFANNEIYRISSENDDLRGMGTTCTAMYYYDGFISVAHVGDSRAYMIRNNKIDLITRDHTVAQQLLESGTIDHNAARTCPERNILLRAVGTSPLVDVDTYPNIPVQAGDIFIICSDGLTEYLNEDEILDRALNNSIEDVCDVLIALANMRGGADNITVQVVKINDITNDSRGILKRLKGLIG